ncbi:phi13 family phage major tail protein [Paenibacillus sp. DS2015]|uniref:major tail protein n=1 Tax=Paenibacillus sp. DS2015 TaxID=3373917 RepID=UPI003D243759
MPELSIPVGLRSIYYAILTADEITGAIYATPKPLVGAIGAKVTPSMNTATLYIDDGPGAVASSLGEIAVEFNIADIPYEVSAELLGQTLNADGVLKDNSNDQAPYVAMGYIRSTNTGKDRFTWLLKGKFSLPSEEAATKGDKVEFQTPTITGSFIKRRFDDNWRFQIDSASATAKPEVVAAWFEQVYSELAQIPNP